MGKDVCSLGNLMEELKAPKIGQQQFQTVTKECLVDRTKPIDDKIHRNRLKLFVGSRTKTASKEKQQLTLMKSDVSTLPVKREMAIWKTSFSKRTKHDHQRSPMEEDYDLVPRVTS